MIRRPPRSTRTDTLFPYTTLFRSAQYQCVNLVRLPCELDYPEPLTKYEPPRPSLWNVRVQDRSEEHTSELQSLMRISYAVFCLKKKNTKKQHPQTHPKYTLLHIHKQTITDIQHISHTTKIKQ